MLLNPIFSEGAVLQRDTVIPIWGKGSPNGLIRVELAGREAFARASGDGSYIVHFPPLGAGGPWTLAVHDLASGQSSSSENVMIGEVWLASGQSNMEYRLGSTWSVQSMPADTVNLQQEREFMSTALDGADFRIFTVERTATGAEEHGVKGCWRPVTPDTCSAMSAVALWYGRYLRNALHCPVGIISSAWAGTVIEAWISRGGLQGNADTRRKLEEYDALLSTREAWTRDTKADYERTVRQCISLPSVNRGYDEGWASPGCDDSSWLDMQVPGSWIRQKIAGNGVVWVRKTVKIPSSLEGRDLVLEMGSVDKQDITYFNGVEVGRSGAGLDMSHWNCPRRYIIPGACVCRGRNSLAIRAFSWWGDGAFCGAAGHYRLRTLDGTTVIPLGGSWKARVEQDAGLVSLPAQKLQLGPGNPNSPTILFESMILPLCPFALRGVIWYQGENNANALSDAETYGLKLTALMQDWRGAFQQPSLPFLVVQLAGYGRCLGFDPCSAWAELRHQQRLATEDDDNAYLVSAVDLGDSKDVHPKDKKTVGWRLAQAALSCVYGCGESTYTGPLLRRWSRVGDSMMLSFDHAQGLSVQGNPGKEIVVAGAQRTFFPVDSWRVQGDQIFVSSKSVSDPVAVRYGWSDCPVCVIFNEAGLPASPFRTDDWSSETVMTADDGQTEKEV